VRRIALLAALGAGIFALPVAAQSGPRTRDDSLAMGRKIVQWVYDSQVDSLWARLEEPMRAGLGTQDNLQREVDGVAINFGSEIEVLQETVTPIEGAVRYVREVRFEARPDEIRVWTFDLTPDGMIRNAQFDEKAAERPKAPADSAAARPSN
jgi:hypothetical protein